MTMMKDLKLGDLLKVTVSDTFAYPKETSSVEDGLLLFQEHVIFLRPSKLWDNGAWCLTRLGPREVDVRHLTRVKR